MEEVMSLTRKPKFKYNNDENNSNYLIMQITNSSGNSFVATLNRKDNSGHIKNSDDVIIADIPAGNIVDVNQAVQNYMTNNLSCSFWGNQTPSTIVTVVINPQYAAQHAVYNAWVLYNGTEMPGSTLTPGPTWSVLAADWATTVASNELAGVYGGGTYSVNDVASCLGSTIYGLDLVLAAVLNDNCHIGLSIPTETFNANGCAE